MQFYGKVVRCDNTECGLPVFRLKANRTLTDDEIKDLLTDGHTKLLKGFKSKQGKSFDAVVAFDGDYNTTFVFPERPCRRTAYCPFRTWDTCSRNPCGRTACRTRAVRR